MNSLYFFAKKIHRTLMLVILLLTGVMAFTGALMKYTSIARKLNLDLADMRIIHNATSTLFTGVLIIMALTGVIMYFAPVIKNSKR